MSRSRSLPATASKPRMPLLMPWADRLASRRAWCSFRRSSTSANTKVPMIKVRIPTPLRPLTGGKGEVETQASDIQSLIESLNGQFPGLKERICDGAGEIRRFVNIYLNEEDI